MDIREIPTKDKVRATVSAPPSKSYTNRAYVIAALADGPVRLENPLCSDDTRYMKAALEALGIRVEEGPEAVTVHGKKGVLRVPEKEIFVGNAGTAMRFLTTLACLAPGEVHLTGDARMQERPIEDLLAALRRMGAPAHSLRSNGCPPLRVGGGTLPGGTVRLPGGKSSQYLTSLLLSAPCFKTGACIEILGDLTSKSYVDITLDIMETFGVHVENAAYRRFSVAPGQSYKARTYRVEGDASSASYFLAAAAVTGGEVTVTNLNPQSVQGDLHFADVLAEMGCAVRVGDGKITVRGNPLHGITVSMNDMPDTAPTLAVVALFASGATTITGIGNLRIKETDRIGALASELTRLGTTVEAGDDYLKVTPGPLTGAAIETYHDHRMAMSFAVAGLRVPGVRIMNPRCVDKSFPEFFTRFMELY